MKLTFWSTKIASSFLVLITTSASQHSNCNYNPIQPPNTYRSPCNPHYWKNRLPYPGYWQQDVYYRINAYLNTDSHFIDATLHLTYWNNSPDTLDKVFFHLYQNAFQPGSYYDRYVRDSRIKPMYGPYESQKLGTVIFQLAVDGKPVNFKIHNTIMEVPLPRKLLPEDSITFTIRFRTYFDDKGNLRRRMKMFDVYVKDTSTNEIIKMKHYDAVHWYPRISVYDRKFGWTTDQHLDKEFYGDFGTFEVTINAPECYVIEATGNLLNRPETLPDSLFRQLHISNFITRTAGKYSYLFGDCSKRKTWHFYAENVHDFAFTADPTYRIDTARWQNITCVVLVQEPHARYWQNVADFTCQVVSIYYRDFGPYIWHKVVVADARDGMEYPMLTLCGGIEPHNYGLIAHEVGHMWFFGHIGNNETYRAFLDEGFTQFLTVWALEKTGNKISWWGSPVQRKFRDPILVRDARIYMGYIMDAQRKMDMPLATHSSDFNNAPRHGGGYRHVYYKTAAMLQHLRMILGDSLFLKAMQYYYRKWYLCHPYEEDFRKAIIEFTRMDLNFLFDAYMYTTRRFDYSITKLRTKKLNTGSYMITIKLKRKEEGTSPLRVFLYGSNDSLLKSYYIPYNWWSTPAQPDAIVLKPWYGWGPRFNRRYTITDTLDVKPRRVVIDSANLMPDIYVPDNSLPRSVKIFINTGIAHPPQRYYRIVTLRPALWWNSYSGIMAGIYVFSDYMKYRHTINTWVWFTPSTLPWWMIHYSTHLEKLLPLAKLKISLSNIAGLQEYSASISHKLKRPYTLNNHTLKYSLISININNPHLYLPFPEYSEPWSGQFHLLISLGASSTWKIPSRLIPQIKTMAEFTQAVYAPEKQDLYSWIALSASWHLNINRKLLRASQRLYLWSSVYGTPPLLLQPGLASAPLYEWRLNPVVITGVLPEQWLHSPPGSGIWYVKGGANIRAFAGYHIPYPIIASLNTQLTAPIINNILTKTLSYTLLKRFVNIQLEAYAFLDMGWVGKGSLSLTPSLDPVPYTGTGIGTSLTIRRVGVFDGLIPLTVRVEAPLWDNVWLWKPRVILSVEWNLWKR